ncbi:acyltransferase family protein [Lunatibacter salilacus]|uniref:acyltransferase family protein n=1 Tax=Lunatibacter salilacus TaxID=2483804 RepID=UPI00131A6ADF|nr:acyltransferase [Lunatibacter salilacus]
MQYRKDIDGLRAFAVIAVVLFHLGFLPNGYLGVDIFFVISGFLITSIIYNKSEKNEFSILDFYLRRIRRIIPLLLFTTTLALGIGIFLMLPDDLDSLSQAVFASNFSANNILMYITASDYWAVRNEYKPLMHTWSLGIEEQFYLIFPFIFLSLQGKKVKFIMPTLLVLTILSGSLFLLSEIQAQKFYLLPHRFFEFTAGGIGAIAFGNGKLHRIASSKYLLNVSVGLILSILLLPFSDFNSLKVIVITFSTTALLVVGKHFSGHNKWYKYLFENQVVVTIGKISFSIYMMHQLIFAFARYAYLEEITVAWAFLLILLTISVSFLTYRYIENPFRNHQLFSIRKVLVILIPLFLVSSAASFYIYSVGGIIKDYPVLDVYKGKYQFERGLFRVTTNIHIQYNEDVRKLDKGFEKSDKLKVLVYGNSFGRDVTNILLESEFEKDLQISFFDVARATSDEQLRLRIEEADLVFFASYGSMSRKIIPNIETRYQFKIDQDKIWAFGIKDFGVQNGIHYNRMDAVINYSTYRTQIAKKSLEKNEQLKTEWATRYIDLIGPIINGNGEVLVFTPEGKFISPDTAHLTKAGATYYAELLRTTLNEIISEAQQKSLKFDDSL